jgi:AcrR family transcriptional regulator
MGEKAEYKSAIRSRRLIRQAFLELMKEKELEKITVTDIITRADINRGTFYTHYKYTRAVIEQIENDIIEKMREFLKGFQYRNFLNDPLPILLKISGWLEDDLEFYRILINSRGAEQFLVKLKDIFVKFFESDNNIPKNIRKSPGFFVRIHFFAGGIINLYQLWFRGEIDSTLDELALEISKIVTSNSVLVYEKKR